MLRLRDRGGSIQIAQEIHGNVAQSGAIFWPVVMINYCLDPVLAISESQTEL